MQQQGFGKTKTLLALTSGINYVCKWHRKKGATEKFHLCVDMCTQRLDKNSNKLHSQYLLFILYLTCAIIIFLHFVVFISAAFVE